MFYLRPATVLILLILSLLMFSGCVKPIPYLPSELATFDGRAENSRLEFETDEGRQVAFYLPPLNAPEKPPTQINILYPGIHSVALDWQQHIPLGGYPDVAYLLIDYPGRGLCEGSMRPEKVHLNTEGALKALAQRFDATTLDAELSLLGHSFGTGAALQFAARAKVSRIVLISPFNTLKQAVALQSWFLSIIMPAQIDNKKIIHELLQSGHPPKITILHGSLDTVLPVRMGRELGAIAPEQIDFYEFAKDDHVSILTTRRDMIFSILNGRND